MCTKVRWGHARARPPAPVYKDRENRYSQVLFEELVIEGMRSNGFRVERHASSFSWEPAHALVL